MLVATPVGVAAAVFTSEFAPRRLKELLKPTIELLAGIPSVVLGFFALMVMATWMQSTFGFSFRLNAVVAGLGLALTIVPVVYTVSEDALAAVPRSFREASLALGATRWETALRVVLPAAAPGVLAAVVLGFGRAIGETMIVLMASGNAAITSWSFGDSVRTLPATIAAEMGEVVFGGGALRRPLLPRRRAVPLHLRPQHPRGGLRPALRAEDVGSARVTLRLHARSAGVTLRVNGCR